MCRPGGRHFTGSSKRVEAFSKSSNLVVNSVSLSRDLPVFPGFFEIIRVVGKKILDFQQSGGYKLNIIHKAETQQQLLRGPAPPDV